MAVTMTKGEPITTPEERQFLALIAKWPRGIVVLNDEDKQSVMRMCTSGLVSDCYEVSGGGYTARITALGKTELELFPFGESTPPAKED
jgi:hypothetical protein